MDFNRLYTKLSAIFGVIIALFFIWILLFFSGVTVANYLGNKIGGWAAIITFIVILIIGVYLSVKIITWSNKTDAKRPEQKKGATLFNSMASLPNPLLTIFGLLLLWFVLLTLLTAITTHLTGFAQTVVNIIGIIVGCYISWRYFAWVIKRWKERAAE